jgi:hypothetical protein
MPNRTALLGLVVVIVAATACNGAEESQSDAIWTNDSVALEFALTGAVSLTPLCEFSATRQDLSAAQIEGLSSLRLHPAKAEAGCDDATYEITVHAKDGGRETYWATLPVCRSTPILLFDDFEAWAQSTPCSLKTARP